jgi:hypothetical protein
MEQVPVGAQRTTAQHTPPIIDYRLWCGSSYLLSSSLESRCCLLERDYCDPSKCTKRSHVKRDIHVVYAARLTDLHVWSFRTETSA